MQRKHFLILLLLSGLMTTMWLVTNIQRAALARQPIDRYEGIEFDGAEIIINDSIPLSCVLTDSAYAAMESVYQVTDPLARQIEYLEEMNGELTLDGSALLSDHPDTAASE